MSTYSKLITGINREGTLSNEAKNIL